MPNVFQFGHFQQFPELVHGVSTVEFGNMSFNWGEDADVKQNRNQFFTTLNVAPEQVVVASLLHGATVVNIEPEDRGKGIVNREDSVRGDSLVTSKPDTFLFLVVADCLALFCYEPVKKVCALAHAGWRGLEAEVPKNTLTHMVKEYGCDAQEIWCGFSPMQRRSRNPQVLKSKDFWLPYQVKTNDDAYVDLVKAALDQVQGAGVLLEHIEDPGIDTVTDRQFFSHRRSEEAHEPEGRFGCLIGFRS